MYCIDKNCKILFYGYPRFAMVKNKVLDMQNNGFHIEGFIDRNAKKFSRQGIVHAGRLMNCLFQMKNVQRQWLFCFSRMGKIMK